MTLKEAISRLRRAGVPSPEWDAREIFRHFGGYSFGAIISPDTEASDGIEAAILRREGREPLQYIIGEVGFYKESYLVSEDCLIPRADTEILVDYAVKHIPRGESFIDFCTGSGCIAISTLASTVDTRACAVDISRAALEIARKNAERNRVCERLTLLEANLLLGTPEELKGKRVHAVLSNPPYIDPKVYEELDNELFFEPRIALVAEDCGRRFYDLLLPLSLELIKDDGFIAFEIGFDQAEHLRMLAEKHSCEIEIIKDYSGNDRVAVLKKQKG